ncbi:hypothetical protein Taro_038430 [Colocasia esculenta]|uniref:HMA domain-containing protein n=1 Tax=Colocasia esculenta TaxID=4460 RepID=A0A843WM73_COLES|nr:hypothetical protein [Colocasia esculenta]
MAGEENGGKNGTNAKYQKSYFDVLGLCCSSEVPLIEKILQSLDGVVTVSVIVPSRTVIVVHDGALVTQLQIVKALNQARLEATVRAYGTGRGVRHWPSPYTIACGVLLAISFLKPVYRPLQWLAVVAVAAGLPPILLRAVAAIRRLTLDINILMLIAVGGSIALKDYWEAGAIVFLFTIAEWLESRASYKATAVMSALMSMAPQKAVLADTGEVVDANEVKVNTVLAVKAGEVIPIDGVVVEGRSEVDESSLTGESFPVAKHPQSQVWAGTLNINGYISVKTTALAENSAVAKMTKLVEEAQNSKSRTQRLIDTCAKYYTPSVVLVAALLAVIPVALKAHNVKHWLRLALVLLVSACPCALVLSTPVATFCALTRAAKTGLLVKGGDFLEAIAKTKVVAFDKTGTITRGEFTVTDFKPAKDVSLHSLLYWVSSVESKSSHPMAAALTDYARSSSVEPKPDNVGEFHIYPGEGIYGEIDGKHIYIGNQRIATRAGCAADDGLSDDAGLLWHFAVPDAGKDMKGVTVGYVFSGATPVGVFSLSDTCRTGAAEAVRGLKRMGIKTAMLTGDSNAAAMFAQNQLGNALDIVRAELLPEDKVSIVRDLKTKEGPTVMVGDGMNDAPALAMADVGVSMGISGSAVAMETSHITLMSNDVRKIPEAIRLGKRTMSKIIQNISMSVVTKAAIIGLAFAGHPLLWAAILSDVGTCLLVIFNSMLLLKSDHGRGKCWGSSSHRKGHAHGHGAHHHHAGAACGAADRCEAASEKCCSHGGGCGDAGEARAHGKCSTDVAHHYQHEHGCSTSTEPTTCHSHSHDHEHDHDHGHHHDHHHDHDHLHDHDHDHGHHHIHSHDHIHGHHHAHDRAESSAHAVEDPGSPSHSISIASEAGHHGDCCAPSPTKCADGEQHHGHCLHEEEPALLHDVCAHKKDEISEVRESHVSCEKPIVCTATCHSHHICRDFRKRPVATCCRSYCSDHNWSGCKRGDLCCAGAGVPGGGGLPQLKEIITE